ncbi:LPXTG cell wall anchor domain-containing protein [Cellulomonas edaphi]|uniref:LPXTG cell wall anchor domain-containing protein n=1 Tax=Cellulomonas edaphi TaxID=3053468 RepID=A0ABT7S9A0_9CELL|nr:LPXTG cell wall anchor domain-containing protein [Cellulomons edaphi]MDM7832198.1 LPXTG cell wall anchor domain-containing protein [Cellulomons edaphi]
MKATPFRRLAAAGGAVALLAVLASPGVADPLPVDEPFNGATFADPAWVLPGGSANSTTLTGDALRLTSASPGFQAGNATLDDAFRSDVAFTVDFDYAAYGGGNPGDAMTFFLMDAAQDPTLGGSGGSAGYYGMQGAYLAVGLDNAGNFAADNQFTNAPNTVVLRGPSTATPDPWPVLSRTAVPGGSVQTVAGSPRHVQVVVEPSGTDSIFVTVRVNAVAGGPLTTVYDRVDVRTLGRGTPARPAQFNLGFSAATGGATNNYEVSNLVASADVDLAVAKSGPASVVPGTRVTWELQATNDDTNPVGDAVLTDSVPAGVEDVTWECTGSATACPTPPTGAASGGTISVPLDLLRDESVTVTVTGTATDALAQSSITNTATITAASRTELAPADNEASWTTRVQALPDLAPTVTVDQNPLRFGGAVTWTVDVDNLADDDGEAPDAAVSVTVPPLVDRSSITAPAACTPSPAGFLCSLGPIDALDGRTLTFSGTASGDLDDCTDGDSRFTATTSTSATDADPSNDVDAVDVPCTVPVDLAITKSASAAEVTTGDDLTYSVVVANRGQVPAPDTRVDDALPAGFDDATWTCRVSDGSPCAPASGSGDVDGVTATIPAGGSATIVVDGTATPVGQLTNTATLTACAACTDASTSDDAATVTTTVLAAVVPPTPTPTPPSPTPTPTPTQTPGDDGLATTGSDAGPQLAWAGALVAAGGLALLISRRRKTGS